MGIDILRRRPLWTGTGLPCFIFTEATSFSILTIRNLVNFYEGLTTLMTNAIVFLVILFAIFTQTVTGFGLALVSMPILAGLIGVRTATPLIVLVAIVSEIILLVRYKSEINLRAVWRLAAAGAIGIPLGVWALKEFNEQFVLAVLGIFVVVYAIYALLNLRLPSLNGNLWPYGFGFVSGVVGGAYNVAGPLVIIYGNCRKWQPKEFKGNLQGYFLVGSLVAMISHALANNITQNVVYLFVLSLPAIAIGLFAGLSLDKYLNPSVFRKIVLIGLIFAGASLVF